MPVLVACSCGKQLRVPDAAVGKNIRCPACKAVLLATPSAPPTLRTASAPETDTTATMVRFSCGACGKEMQALVEYGGQETSCPECNAAVLIPGRGAVAPVPDLPTAFRTAAPDLSTYAQGARSTNDGPSSSRRLRPARRKRRVWLWAALALVLIGGGLIAWFVTRTPPTPDMPLVPADAQGFVTVRAAELWKADALIGFRNRHSDILEDFKKREEQLGLKLEECERITLVFKDVDAFFSDRQPDSAWWAICVTTHPYDQKKLLDNFVPGATEETFQNRPYRLGTGDAKKRALYFHSERVFVFGPKEGVHACLDQVAFPKTEGPLKEALKEAFGKHHLVAGFAPPASALEKLKKDLPAGDDKSTAILDAQLWTLTANLEAELVLELVAAFADADKAGKGKTAAEVLKGLALAKIDAAKKAAAAANPPPPPQLVENLKQVETTLNGMNVEQRKNTVVVQGKSTVANQSALLEMLLQTLR